MLKVERVQAHPNDAGVGYCGEIEDLPDYRYQIASTWGGGVYSVITNEEEPKSARVEIPGWSYQI